MNKTDIYKRATALGQRIESNEYGGYDPYDFKAKDLYITFATKNRPVKIAFELVNFFFPQTLRTMMGVTKNTTFPSVLGYMLEGSCLLYRTSGDNKWLQKAEKIAKKLLSLQNTSYPGASWGLPFAWYSGGGYYFPPNTPNVVNTAEVASGFIELYKITKQDKYKKVLNDIATFITNGLCKTHEDDHTLCVSYTPLDTYQVHNANLLAAATLCTIGRLLHKDSLITKAEKMALFAVNDQLPEGNLPYHSRVSSPNKKHNSDLYHAGYEIRSLYTVYKQTGRKEIYNCLQQYMQFFERFFLSDAYPVTINYHGVRIASIHGCAEAVYCCSVLSSKSNTYMAYAERMLDWTLDNMYQKNGYFINEIRTFGIISHRSKIEFVRWGQAVMFRATARFLYEKYGKQTAGNHIL